MSLATVEARPAITPGASNITYRIAVTAFNFLIIRNMPHIGFWSTSWLQLSHLFFCWYMVVRRKKNIKA